MVSKLKSFGSEGCSDLQGLMRLGYLELSRRAINGLDSLVVCSQCKALISAMDTKFFFYFYLNSSVA